MRSKNFIKYISCVLLALSCSSVFAENTKDAKNSDVTLPIENFASLAAIREVRVSPDGKHIGITRSTSREGDYIVEIRKTDDLEADPVRFGSDRMELRGFFWINSEKIGINFRQSLKDGGTTVWASQFAIKNIDGTGGWELPYREDNYSIVDTLPDEPNYLLLSRDIDDNGYNDIVRYNLKNGRKNTVVRGNQKAAGFFTDSKGEIRGARTFDAANTSQILLARLPGEEEWIEVYENLPANRVIVQNLGFVDNNPQELWMLANNGENTAGIYRYNFVTKEWSDKEFGLEKFDASSVILSDKPGDRGRLLGFAYWSKYPMRYLLDEEEQAMQDAIEDLFPKKYVRMISRSDDDNAIIVYTEADKDPGTYYLLKDKKDLRYIAERRPNIKEENLGSMRFVTYTARDGLKIPAYVTIPPVGKKPYPTVVLPHGGPWARDQNIWDEWSQLLANNGYLVIQPQFRGSTGFGMDLWTAGDAEWGQKMQDDKDDGAKFLVDRGLADPERLAIFGWSYGGYAAFVGSMRENNIYKCAVAGAGVSNLNRISATVFSSRFLRVRQEPTIKGLNPIEHVDKVNVPIMVVHGDIDYRVPIVHSEEFVAKLEEYGKRHKYVELEGADHFSDRLYYNHKEIFYSNLIDWLDNSCFAGPQVASTN